MRLTKNDFALINFKGERDFRGNTPHVAEPRFGKRIVTWQLRSGSWKRRNWTKPIRGRLPHVQDQSGADRSMVRCIRTDLGHHNSVPDPRCRLRLDVIKKVFDLCLQGSFKSFSKCQLKRWVLLVLPSSHQGYSCKYETLASCCYFRTNLHNRCVYVRVWCWATWRKYLVSNTSARAYF